MSTDFEIQLSIGLVEDETHTRAVVALELAGKNFQGVGMARRSPNDPNVPEVGEELATSRAFSQLAHELLEAATARIEQFKNDG